MSEPEVPPPGFDSSPEPANNSTIIKDKVYTNVNKHNSNFQNSNNRDSDTLNIQNNNNTNIDDVILSNIRSNLSREGRYGVISIRVSMRAKYMWDSFDLEHKRILREAIENLILGYGIQYQKQHVVNVNVNINVAKAEAKAESKQQLNISDEIIKIVNILYKNRDKFFPLYRDLVEKLYKLIAEQAGV